MKQHKASLLIFGVAGGAIRILRALWAVRMSRFLILSCVLYVVPFGGHASPMDFDPNHTVLGSANSFGHARIERSLGDLSIGGGTYPVKLVFNSNPAIAPGAFGPYWRIPLFASTVVQYKQYNLYWDGPDERRQFFTMDRAHESRRGEKLFIEHGKDWKATITLSGDVLIESLEDADWYFRYDKGLLQEFKLGTSADACRISYSGRGLPLYALNVQTSRRIFEIEYRGVTEPERVIIGDKQISVAMGDVELTAPDGTTNYRNYRVSFLRSLTHGDDVTEYFAYSKSDTLRRQVTLVDQAKKKVVKTLDLAVNRMEISSDPNKPDSDNWIEWEAKSGFITSDSGSSYEVRNDAWDPNVQDLPFSVTPVLVEITRLPIGGDAQKWSYGWKSGVRVYTDLATGETVRRTMIMSGGPASGKLRKREVLKDGKWTLDRQNSYDPQGRPIRAVHGGDLRIWKWEEGDDFTKNTKYLNGVLVEEIVSFIRSGERTRSRFLNNGNKITTLYSDNGLHLRTYVNDSLDEVKEYDNAGHLKKVTFASGRMIRYEVDGDIVEKITYRFDLDEANPPINSITYNKP